MTSALATRKETQDRQRRALTQPLCLLSRELHEDEILTFEVQGQQAQYRIAYCLDSGWTCTCPDFSRRRKTCKHIYFVIVRALQIDLSESMLTGVKDRDWNQTVYGEPRKILDALNARLRSNEILTNPAVIEKEENDGEVVIVEKDDAKDTKTPNDVKQREFLNEECSICFEVMSAETPVVFCYSTCGKSLHKSCFHVYQQHSKTSKCPNCRADMDRYPAQALTTSTRPKKRQRLS